MVIQKKRPLRRHSVAYFIRMSSRSRTFLLHSLSHFYTEESSKTSQGATATKACGHSSTKRISPPPYYRGVGTCTISQGVPRQSSAPSTPADSAEVARSYRGAPMEAPSIEEDIATTSPSVYSSNMNNGSE